MIQYILTIRNTLKNTLLSPYTAQCRTTCWGRNDVGSPKPYFGILGEEKESLRATDPWKDSPWLHLVVRPRVVGWKPRSFSLANTSSHREFQLWWSKVFKMPCHWGRRVTWIDSWVLPCSPFPGTSFIHASSQIPQKQKITGGINMASLHSICQSTPASVCSKVHAISSAWLKVMRIGGPSQHKLSFLQACSMGNDS